MRWKASGLSDRDFCYSKGLSEPSFYSWRRTLNERDAANTPALVPFHVRSGSAPPTLKLVIQSGHVLRVPHGCVPQQLRLVPAALELASC